MLCLMIFLADWGWSCLDIFWFRGGSLVVSGAAFCPLRYDHLSYIPPPVKPMAHLATLLPPRSLRLVLLPSPSSHTPPDHNVSY